MLALQTYSRVQFYGTDYLGFDGLSLGEFLKQRVELGEVVVAVLVIVFVANSDHRIATEHLQLINRHPSNRYEQRPFDFAGLHFLIQPVETVRGKSGGRSSDHLFTLTYIVGFTLADTSNRVARAVNESSDCSDRLAEAEQIK